MDSRNLWDATFHKKNNICNVASVSYISQVSQVFHMSQVSHIYPKCPKCPRVTNVPSGPYVPCVPNVPCVLNVPCVSNLPCVPDISCVPNVLCVSNVACVQKKTKPYLLWLPLCTQRWRHVGLPLSDQCILSVCLSYSFMSACPALSIVQVVEHETLTQCWANVGPLSTTLSQH